MRNTILVLGCLLLGASVASAHPPPIPLRIKEIDGSPSCKPRTLEVTNTTLACVGSTATLTIAPGASTITEAMLKAVNSPTDEFFLTYETTTGDFEWQSGSGVAGSDTQVIFNDGGVAGADAGLVYNKTTDLLTAGELTVDNIGVTGNSVISRDVNGNINLTPNGSGNVVSTRSFNTSVAGQAYIAGASNSDYEIGLVGGGSPGLRMQSDAVVGGTGTSTGNDALDWSISRVAAGVVGIGTGAAGSFAGTVKSTTLLQESANGAQWVRGQASELLTLSTSGATTDTAADLLPANSIIEAVVARVTTTITTATDWKLGDPTTAGRFTAANGTMTAGTTDIGLVHIDQTGAAGPRQTAAAKVRVTTTGTPGAGAVRITVFYRQFVAPTS